MLSIVTGLVAGSLHVISGPDHLAAMAPLAVDNSRRSARLGALWGLGHGVGVCALGGLGIYARTVMDVELFSGWSEFLVGIVLVFVGIWAIRRSFGITIHAHGHHHRDQNDHEHFHVHTGANHVHQDHRHTVLGVGALHGAAGTGHLFGVVPAMALGTFEALLYLTAYLLAAVGSMALFGGLIGRLVDHGGQNSIRRLLIGSGTIAMAVGLVWSLTSVPTL